jgi:hypothetical protein
MAGKGDDYRRVDQKKWDQNYERIFEKKSTETHPNKMKEADHGKTPRTDRS